MAKDTHILNYTSSELDELLNRADNKPFVIWHDEIAGVYRFFPDEEKKNLWVEAYLNDDLTPELEAYQFVDPVTAPAPYTINVVVLNDNKSILFGTSGITLDYTFISNDKDGQPIKESVDVYYTFSSPSGIKTTSIVYNANPSSEDSATRVSINIDKYISLGTNTISIMVRGRSTNAIKTVVATYNVVALNLSSTFQIARSIQALTPFEISYTVEGYSNKVVEFFIDGELKANPTISSLEPIATKIQRLSGLLPGKHTLQMRAKMQVGEDLFKSNLLYYEFIVRGSELTTTVISEIFPNTQDIFSGAIPGLSGEQYVIKTINWAYYSSNYTMYNATVQWRLYTEGGAETPIATRNADVVEAETDAPPEPLQFMPTEYGTYNLQALVNGNIIGDYTIAVIRNTSGILESTEGLTMKLSGLGRDNSEPLETLDSWSNGGFSTTFYNMPWNGNSGWNNNALVFNNGSTAIINNKPFSIEVAPQTRSGCVFEIDFETFNVNDENAELLRIGDQSGPSLVITSNKAVLTSSFGRQAVSIFKTDERIKVAFVVYPNSGTDYNRKVFVYNNGVMSCVMSYELADNFNIGSQADTENTLGMIHLGNPIGSAGIKIYYIRTYNNFITMYDELNNVFIDSGDNLQSLVDDNDIYSPGTKLIDVDKLESTITTIKITGPLNELINRGSGKGTITAALEVVSPQDSTINMHCSLAQISNAGQSTLDKPVPSFHVKLDKNGNVCYDRDGNLLSKNRWAFRNGNVPEKKFRLQANYMDSSCCHNGAFLRLFNIVSKRVKIGNDSVLRIPADKYATDEYPNAMRNKYGNDPSGNGWKFPYTINITPDSIPGIIVWRPDEGSAYRFLGQYVIMEEKKANYANGMRSIYDGLDANGNPDPFGFKSQKSPTRLWDNAGCHQIEVLRSTEDLTLFLNDEDYNNDRDESFELVYPDEDDLTPAEIEIEWQKFYNDVVHPIVSSKNNQEAFDSLLYGPNPKLDRWHFAAYYCLAMRNACTDSLVRNMEFITYDGNKWLPKWWDVDMECGLQQTGECNIEPTSDRNTLAPGTNPSSPNAAYAFSGRMKVDGVLKSSWLWDGLQGSLQFQEDIKTMDNALYHAGWTYTQMTNLQDNDYVNSWSKSLYNESSVSKYLFYNDLSSLQGDRTPHRHWFLKTSYDYFDALNVCGEYTSKIISIRTQSISPDKIIEFQASSTSYFGWGYTNNIVESGIEVQKDSTGYLTIDRTLALNDPLHIYAANKMSYINFEPIAECIAGSDIDFSSTYDDLLGSQFKTIIIGVSKERMNQGIFNLSSSATQIQGAETLNRLETLNIQGMQYFVALDMNGMSSLKNLYASGTRLDSFNPAPGSELNIVELPTTITSMQMDGCNLTKTVNGNPDCVIDWYDTLRDQETNLPIGISKTTVPNTLRVLRFSGMGSDKGTQILIFDWLNAVYNASGDQGLSLLEITCNNINWEGVSVSDLLLLSKIPEAQRKMTGRIKCQGTLTGQDIVNIQEAFGEGVFSNDPGVPLRVDADSGFVIGAPSEILAGESVTISGVSFPISESSSSSIIYMLGTRDQQGYFVPTTALTNVQGKRYYQVRNAVLYEETGYLVTQETSDPDYSITVKGISISGSSDEADITVKKRTYPSSLIFDVSWTNNKNVKEDTPNNAYYVNDNDLLITIDVSSIPETVNGTLDNTTWTISSSIESLIEVKVQTENKLQFYVANAGNTLSRGAISNVRTYVDGTVVSRTTDFLFKIPFNAVTSSVNPQLQNYLYAAGYTLNPNVTTDVDLWSINSLTPWAIGEGSTLVHLAELNQFINLNMSNLDLSYCTNLGSNDNLVLLEDLITQDYVNVLPRANQTLDFDFEEIDLSNTQLKGINLKSGSVLETISYSNATTNIELINQTALTEVNIPIACLTSLETLTIENCNILEEITWV